MCVFQLDEDIISIASPSLRGALALSAADRRWIDLLTQIVNETWDDAHPQHPKTHGFIGSEEFIRLQFEEYLLALLSCMKYHEELASFTTGEAGHRSKAQLQNFNIEGDPALDFNPEFLSMWQTANNYALFTCLTSDALLFSITEPKHPSAGGLTIDDIQRRLSQQVADLHLDERVREGREALNRHFSTGQKKVTAAFNSFWSDIEAMREAQRKRNEEKSPQSQRASINEDASISPPPSSRDSATDPSTWFVGRRAPPIDVTQAQASASAAGQKASAYFSSWGSWANEKRREWQEKHSTSPSSQPGMSASPSVPSLSSVTEAIESDRGRRRSMNRHSDDATGLGRSVSRRKRWSNILLRRESSEFASPQRQRRDVSIGSDTFAPDPPYPKSPLSQGSHAYESESEEKPEEKPGNDPGPDDDGFTSVPLTTTVGLGLDVKPEQNTSQEEPKSSSLDDTSAAPSVTDNHAESTSLTESSSTKDEAHTAEEGDKEPITSS